MSSTDINSINNMNETDTIKDTYAYVDQVKKFLQGYDNKREEAKKQIEEHENKIQYATMKDNNKKLEYAIDEYIRVYEKEEKIAIGKGNYTIKFPTYNTLEDLYNNKKSEGEGNTEGMKKNINIYIGWYCDEIEAITPTEKKNETRLL